MSSARVEIPPYAFHVHESGSGTPLILIHGLGGSSDWWRRNIDDLSREYRVFAPDLVGFGRNRFVLRRSHLPLHFDEIASVLARWIESSLREPVHLVGNSMGGQVAIHLAASRPELIRSLTLVNSTGIPFEIAPGAHIENLVVPRGAMSFATILARDLFRAGPTAMAVAFTRLLRDDARPLLRRLQMPVLLLWGERDPLVPLTYAHQMTEVIPNARVQVIPHAGHIPMWENPRAFNDALLFFLRSMERRLQPADGPAKAGAPSALFSWTLSGWTDGIAHREAGRARNVVLVHGLGMSSAYFEPFACALFALGCAPIAPDLPGFGESRDGPSVGPNAHAEILIGWADALQIRNAVWIAHSLRCNAVAHVARLRPDLVRHAVGVGPLWTDRTLLRLLPKLLVDPFREPLALFPLVIAAYWRAGLGRWFMTLRRYGNDLRGAPPAGMPMIAGERDPLTDRGVMRQVINAPGAHACLFAFPESVASLAMGALLQEEGLGGITDNENEHRNDHRNERQDPLPGTARNAD